MSKFPHGVLTGKQVQDVFNDAKVNQYALPAVNVTNTSTVNAVLEAAAEVNSPVIIQFSAGGCQFFAGKVDLLSLLLCHFDNFLDHVVVMIFGTSSTWNIANLTMTHHVLM